MSARVQPFVRRRVTAGRGIRLSISGGLVLLLSALAMLFSSAPAFAHSSLRASSPADGASIAAPLHQVGLEFSENVQSPAFLVVTAPGGSSVGVGAAVVVDSTVTQPLKRLTEAGRYTIGYRIVSADGHPITGALSFTLTSGASSAVRATPAASAAHTSAADRSAGGGSSRWVGVLGVLGVGGAAVAFARNRHGSRRRPELG